MTRQIVFIIVLLATLGVFSYTAIRVIRLFRLTRPAFAVGDIGKRILLTLKVAIAQSRIFRRPFSGVLHALVFWGFCLILFGTIEIVIDGVIGAERSLQILGPFHTFMMAAGDIFALIVAISIVLFLARRVFTNIARFSGEEIKRVSKIDATFALSMIFFLMISLLGTNASYMALMNAGDEQIAGAYPAASLFLPLFAGAGDDTLHLWHELFWWAHILLIFIFANILPYSKHFHVFMSVPNVFLTRLDPPGKLPNMDSITREVKLMLNPETAFEASPAGEEPGRFGVKDAEDATWKNYFDSLACTECGRCTAVCPANITGKRLSPRKVMMDLRSRMKQKGNAILKNGRGYDDGRSLVRDYISEEELWACTTCNACYRECPINIDHPSFIVDMRRYLVMEEGAAPGEIKAIFNNIENNGAPWQYSPEDRLLWAKGLEVKGD